ncbi:ZW10 interactor [Bombina bombina]|uniref:ZW10 interactor n=1 Tax=Bombina bombina TaxID=8345 RepID=UPI00235A617E|nr:ZW10 interactor [Bombina bombina]
MEEVAQSLLGTLQQSLDERPKEEGDEVPAKILVDYYMERRRKQKMLCGQLRLLCFLLDFLQVTDPASWGEEETSPEMLSLEAEEEKGKWKMLKAEYLNKVQEVEGILPLLLKKLQSLQEKKQILENTLQHYQSQKAAAEVRIKKQAEEELIRLQGVVERQQQVVEKCRAHSHQLEEELKRLEHSVSKWVQTVSRDSELSNLLQTLQGISIVSVGHNELVLDMHADQNKVIPPLRVTLRWTSEGSLQVESDDSVPGIPQNLLDGTLSQMRPIILELQSWYRSQARLLQELKGVQERFAIDWLPEKQLVYFLKGNCQYTLLIGHGYPQSGTIQLLSLKGVEPAIEPSTLKPPVESPSLTDWLEYLHSSSHIGGLGSA